MVNLIAQSGHIAYGIKEYVCDTIADLANLPLDGKAGSTAYIIEDSTTYILNSKGEWKQKKNFNNGGSNEELEAEIKALQAQNAELTAANENLTKGNQVLVSANEKLTAQNSELKTEKEELSNQVVELTAKNVNLSNEITELTASNTDLSNQIGKLTAENEKLKKEIEDLTEFVPSAENNSLSVPATSTMIQDTTLIVSADNSEIIGNKLILD